MLRCISLRLTLPILLAATLLPAVAFAQSQDSGSVAEAARRAREQKKTPAKPVKVLTEDDVKPATPATPANPASPDAAAVSAAPASPAANAVSAPAAGSSAAPAAKDQKDSKEVTELKAQIKQAMGDLDLILREQSLEQDNFYSKPDYADDKAGKAKLDALIQQVADKQQALELLKTRLAELLPPQDNSVPAPPKS